MLESERYSFVNYSEHDQQIFKSQMNRNVCSKLTLNNHYQAGKTSSSTHKFKSFETIKKNSKSSLCGRRRCSDVGPLRMNLSYNHSSGSSLGKQPQPEQQISQESLDPYEEFVSNSFTG